MKTLKLGLVGLGRIGQMHARNLLTVAERLIQRGVQLEIVLADARPDAAHQVAEELGLRAAESLESLVAEGIDALVIATNTGTHPEVIRRGIRAGIPMFCEKPVSSNVPDALPLLREIEAAGALVQVGHQRRVDAGYLAAKESLQSGDLGWLYALGAISGDAFPPSIDYIATSGGLFRDVSVHDFDIIRWLTGQEIVEVFASGSNNGDPAIGAAGDVDSACAMLKLTDGTWATVAATRYNGAGHDVRLEVRGSKESVVVGLDQQAALRSAEEGIDFPAGAAHPTFAERFAEAYIGELVAFVELVLGERANPCTPFDAVSASLVADAAQLSLGRGEPVAVPSLRDMLDGIVGPLDVVETEAAR